MITITNNKIYYSEFIFTSLSSLDNVDTINNNEISNFLSDYVDLGESVTFKRLFDIVSGNVSEFNKIFYSSLGGYKLDPFLQEIENNQTEITKIENIELYWNSDKFDNEISISPSIKGISFDDKYYSLDFIGLNNLKNCKIKINKDIDVLDYNKLENKSKKYSMYLGEKYFTVFDLFNAIFNAISFHGGPSDKQEIFKEIEKSILESNDKISDEIEDEELRTVFEDFVNQIDNNNEYLVTYNGFSEEVNVERINIPENLEKLKNCLLEKLKIYDKISKSNKSLKSKYKQLTNIEFIMQMLYGESEDIKFHKFWETPRCICPKIDNIEIYPSIKPIFDDKCPIHGKK